MKKTILSLGVTLFLCLTQVTYASSSVPNVKGKGAVLIEQESGRVLYEHNAYEPLPMASTTKIMTCILAIEEGKLDDIVTTSKRASSAPPVKLHLKVGEKQRLGDLLYALMLQSDNDVAVAIAEHIGGSVEHFCEMMTKKAQSIGAEHTSFKTPNGLDAEGHYASAYDMALIGAYALKNPEFRKIVTTELISIPTIPTENSVRHDLQNKNRFIYSYEGSNGIKTGFTNKAGHCFVGGAVRNNMQLVAASLGAGWGSRGKTQKYTDVINMMNYGYKNYEKVVLIEPQEEVATVPIDKALIKEVKLSCNDKVVMPLTQTEKENVYIKKVLPTNWVAPIKEGETVGELQVICDGVILAKVPLTAEESIDKAHLLDYIKQWLKK
ncbi:MAG: D-alanyl-D-alanine carboxypeptidase [Candidatus Cellulosilyticum pullistercoris]|uniref:serine-type D-Ala-D-Ala carboxypeptidase n=1 Tax=Candidatus Cellulosilyticum pullistercoris TaxID=2838521 RepID=A0A9E2NML9_9FIRM|nr:D-alanyl-D-alanine carboxypeptidase [Candidatus Cellulosilyticum pullistercoris]